MKQSARILLSMFISWVLLFILAKLIFMTFYHQLYTGIGFGDICDVIWHGLKMDLATAGYLSALPGLSLVAGAFIRSPRPIVIFIKTYTAVMSFLVLTIIGIDTTLYGYWDFKLDITPLFYVMTSPAAALASVPVWMIIADILVLCLLTYGLYLAIVRITGIKEYKGAGGPKTALLSMVMTMLLFIPIRGGFGVATVNMSTAFYSNNMRLNHAAVNPAFSLFYSATHQQAFNKMFRFMEPDKVESIMNRLTASEPYNDPETPLLNTTRPDIYIIILESFSNSLFPSLGGEPVATGLDSIAASGLTMSNFYSSTFRTDRAIPAILNGFPAQPTTSLLKYPEKTRHIASLAHSLGKEGYSTRYYYGGDATFANKQTYLLNSGFQNLVTLKDMDPKIERSKWGVPDGALFDRALADMTENTESGTPHLTIVQTLSSHEPFEVPYSNAAFKDDAACNAFAYTDSCATSFINALASRPGWNNTLVIAVPDHYGCYPHNPDPDDVVLRHRIPLIMTGGALNRRGITDTPASQVDMAAMLLDAMDIERSEYRYSRNLLDPEVVPMAFMSTPTYTAVVDTTGVSSVYNIETRTFRSGQSYPSTAADSINAAYLQSIYDTIDNL